MSESDAKPGSYAQSEFAVKAWADVWAEERRSLGLDELEIRPPLDPSNNGTAVASRPQGVALCLSGGGIRSATFALGVLQGLASRKKLRDVHYLSTVSGGGYIGAWLSAWIARHDGAGGSTGRSPIDNVERELARVAAHQAPTSRDEQDAYRATGWLREFSNYLTPRLGVGSLDTWTIVATYIRNLLVNWTLFIPMLLVVMALPRLGLALIASEHDTAWAPAVLPVWSLTLLSTVFAVPLGWMALSDGRAPASNGNRSRMVLVLAITASASAALGWGLAARWAVSGVPAVEVDTAELPATAAVGLVLAAALTVAWLFVVAVCLRRGHRKFFPVLGLLALVALLGSFVLWLAPWRPQPGAGASRAFVVMFALPWACVVALVAHEARRRRTGGRRSALTAYRRMIALAHWFRGDTNKTAYRLNREAVERVLTRCAALGSSALLLWLALGFALGHLYRVLVLWPAVYVCISFPAVLAAFFLVTCLYPATTSTISGKWEEEDREWWGRMGGWMLMAAGAWTALSAVSLFGPELFRLPYGKLLAPMGGVSGLITLALARSGVTGATDERSKTVATQGRLQALVMTVVAPLFVVIALSAIALTVEWLLDSVALLYLGALTVAVFMAQLLLNVNKFSSHAFYRHRLVRGYLAASRARLRRPHPFTGFDADDNLAMYELRSSHLTAANIPHPDELRRLIASGTTALGRSLNAALGTLDPSMTAPDLASTLDALLRDAGRLRLEQEFRSADWQGAAPGGEARGLVERTTALVRDRLAPPSLPVDVWRRIESGWHAEGTAGYMARRRLLEWSFPGLVLSGTQRPMHVVNAALNLTADTPLAWQERKAQSFVFTPLYCGAAESDAGVSFGVAGRGIAGDKGSLGFRRSRVYGGPDGVTLGTAVTISGAAVNSNMGYHSSRTVSFLMTMFNIRLGAWLGNPGKAGGAEGATGPFRNANPRWALLPLTCEAVLGTSASSPYVHLSDGGHFENLGLYEMLRRRCETIYVCDAGCDPGFEFDDLGNAIRKARADLGVEIDLDVSSLCTAPRETGQIRKPSVRHWTIGTITYPEGGTGTLIYLKPTLVGDDEPQDVLNYAAKNPAFPHQSTGDQFFSESQFESYRALGEHIGGQLP